MAWAEAGAGPPLVKAATWLSHLDLDWESPVWRHWLHFFSIIFILSATTSVMRHDRLGRVEPLDGAMDRRSRTVIDAARLDEPVTLLGISQGASTCTPTRYAIPSASRSSFSMDTRGVFKRRQPDAEREYRAIIDLAHRLGRTIPSASLHVAFHPWRDGRADPVVQRPRAETTSPQIARRFWSIADTSMSSMPRQDRARPW